MGYICPNCGYDIYSYYDQAMEEEKDNEFVSIHDFQSFVDIEFSGYTWAVDCKCPACGHHWFFADSSM